MNSEKVALVDMDGTLVDYVGKMQEELESIASVDDPHYDIWDNKLPTWIKKRMDLIKKQPGWWFNLPHLELGFDVLNMLIKLRFEVHVLTKGPYRTTSAWTEKVEWCRKYLPEDVKVTITEDKGLVYGRVLVDDYPDYMLRWLQWRPRGIGIMPLNKHNKNFKHDRVILYDGSNIQEVWDVLHKTWERKTNG